MAGVKRAGRRVFAGCVTWDAWSCRFRGVSGGRGVGGLRGTMGCRFRVVAGRRESPGTAKAVAAFVPHFATAVHILQRARDVNLEPKRSGDRQPQAAPKG